MHPYKKAIVKRKMIEKSGVKPGDQVTVSNGRGEFIFLEIIKGGEMKVKPIAGGRTLLVSPFSVSFKGKELRYY
ncbi:MAG TPA: hypothetical protein VFQ72_01135 [Candidatus Paceibacterota bacterium]|nr:hypothetical protein [Candidatus Paceibacterota bacterium]